MKTVQIHGPRVIPPCAMPDAIVAWYQAHPDAAAGIDLGKLKAGLEAYIAEQVKSGSMRLPTAEELKHSALRAPQS